MLPFKETRSSIVPHVDPTRTVCCASGINASAKMALTSNKRLHIPGGNILCTKPMGVQRDGATLPEIIIEGDGPDTRLHIAHEEAALACAGLPGGTIGSGHMHLRDLTLIADPDMRSIAALEFFQLAWFTAERVTFEGFTYGMWGSGILCGEFRDCIFRNCVINLHMERDATSAPNAISINECEFGMAELWGIEALEPACLNIRGGAVEGCGWNNSSQDGWGGGVRIWNAGTQGAVGANIDGVYFEQNAGLADIYIEHGASDAIYNVRGNSFNRMYADKHTTNCIKVVNGPGRSILTADGNGFIAKDGNYVEDASRKYVAIGGAGTPCVFDWTSFPQRNLCQSAVAI